MNTTKAPPQMQTVLRRAEQLTTALLKAGTNNQIRAGAALLNQLLSEPDAVGIRPTQPVSASPAIEPSERIRLIALLDASIRLARRAAKVLSV